MANGGVEGDPPTPLCLVGYELRSGRLVRLWQDDFGPFPPYRLDKEALIFSYMLSAEFGTHLASRWGQPACALDAYIEFRHYVNDGAAKAEDRGEGFFKLRGALRYFLEDELDFTHKKEMVDRVVQGPPATAEEGTEFDGCENDVRGLARLIRHIVPAIRSLPHALFRGKYQLAIACQERRVLVDLPLLAKIGNRWNDMQTDLVAEMDRPFGIYQMRTACRIGAKNGSRITCDATA